MVRNERALTAHAPSLRGSGHVHEELYALHVTSHPERNSAVRVWYMSLRRYIPVDFINTFAASLCGALIEVLEAF